MNYPVIAEDKNTMPIAAIAIPAIRVMYLAETVLLNLVARKYVLREIAN